MDKNDIISPLLFQNIFSRTAFWAIFHDFANVVLGPINVYTNNVGLLSLLFLSLLHKVPIQIFTRVVTAAFIALIIMLITIKVVGHNVMIPCQAVRNE